MRRVDLLEKILMLWGIRGRRWRGWQRDGWMVSPTQWMWVWVNSTNWWWTERPGVLQSMGSQRVRHDWATELNWYIWKNIGIKTILQLNNKKINNSFKNFPSSLRIFLSETGMFVGCFFYCMSVIGKNTVTTQ